MGYLCTKVKIYHFSLLNFFFLLGNLLWALKQSCSACNFTSHLRLIRVFRTFSKLKMGLKFEKIFFFFKKKNLMLKKIFFFLKKKFFFIFFFKKKFFFIFFLKKKFFFEL